MGAQTATGASGLSPATGPTKGPLGGRAALCPLRRMPRGQGLAAFPVAVPGTQQALHNGVLSGLWLGLLPRPNLEAVDPLKRLRLWTQPT